MTKKIFFLLVLFILLIALEFFQKYKFANRVKIIKDNLKRSLYNKDKFNTNILKKNVFLVFKKHWNIYGKQHNIIDKKNSYLSNIRNMIAHKYTHELVYKYKSYQQLNKGIPKRIMITVKDSNNIPTIQISRLKKLHKDFIIEIYSDIEASKFMREHFGEKKKSIFDGIKDGPIKADYFRVHYLYFGGIYLDSDIYMKKKITDFIKLQGIYIPKSVYPFQINPEFIAVCPNHPFINASISEYEYVTKYIPYTYWNWSCVKVMSRINCCLPNNLQVDNYLFELVISGNGVVCNKEGHLVFLNRLSNYSELDHKIKKNISLLENIKIYHQIHILQ